MICWVLVIEYIFKKSWLLTNEITAENKALCWFFRLITLDKRMFITVHIYYYCRKLFKNDKKKVFQNFPEKLENWKS